MKQLFFSCLAFLFAATSVAQEYTKYDVVERESKVNIGLGLGLDYGFIGGRLSFMPVKRLALFGAVGYAIAGLGYNVGAQVRFIPDGRFCPTFGLMYGSNGVIIIEGASDLNKIYYGTSISGGVEFHFGGKPNFMNVELVVPFRSQEFYDYWDALKQSGAIDAISDPLPVAFSIGYHFALK